MILQFSFIAKLVCWIWDNNQVQLIRSLLFRNTVLAICDWKHDCNVRFFSPMGLHHDAIVLQLSCGVLTSKQKPFPHVSRQSFKISLNRWLSKIWILSSKPNHPSKVFLKVLGFIQRHIISVSLLWFSSYTARSKAFKIIREKETNPFDACKLLNICVIASWLSVNTFRFSSYFLQEARDIFFAPQRELMQGKTDSYMPLYRDY